MSKTEDDVTSALLGDGEVARARVVAWCAEASTVRELWLLYRLTGEQHHRIVPALGKSESCSLIRRYLFECIRLDPHDGEVLSRYEAAQTLEAWYDHLSSLGDAVDVLQQTAQQVTELYLSATPDVQKAIETGFLEHVLEQEALRPLFAHWAHHPLLRDAWDHALAWGRAHPNFMKSLRVQAE